MEKIGTIFGSWFGDFFTKHIGKLIAGTIGALAGIVVTKLVVGLLGTIVGAIVGPIIAPFLAIGLALAAIFGWETIKSWVGEALDMMFYVFEKIGDMFKWIWGKVEPIVSGLWSVIGTMFGWIGDIFSWIYDKVKTPINTIYNVISGMFGWIGDTVDWIWGKIKALNPFSWFGGDDDEDEAEAKIATKKEETVGLTDAEKAKLDGYSPDQVTTAMMPSPTEVEKMDPALTQSIAGTGTSTGGEMATANVNNNAIAEMLYEQNRILKAQLSAIKGLQGNLLKGLG
jgi:hypothetical protein